MTSHDRDGIPESTDGDAGKSMPDDAWISLLNEGASTASVELAAKGLFGLSIIILVTQLWTLFTRSTYRSFAAMADQWVVAGGVLWCCMAVLICAAIWPRNGLMWSKQQRLGWTLSITSAALMVSIKFFMFEVGKLRHNVEMEDFFRASGYPAWFHYAIVALEIAGSLVVLLAGLKGRVTASLMLLGIMVGAILTHVHNGDPWSDAYDALFQAAYLAVLLVLCLIARNQATLRRL